MISASHLIRVSHFALVALVGFALSSCATGYHKTGLTGGYTETQLGPDIFRVSFSGNGFCSNQRAQDLVLLRAADLTVDNGYSYFIVGGEADIGVNQTAYMPGHSYTSGSMSIVGNSAFYSGQTTYFPGMNLNIYKPGQEMLIQCLKHRPNSGMVFDARFLQTSLRAKYKIGPKSPTRETSTSALQTNRMPQPKTNLRHAGGTVYLAE